MEYDQIVKILVSDDADAYDTEGHILSILKQGTAVNVQNNHEEYKKIRQELYSFIGIRCFLRRSRKKKEKGKSYSHLEWKKSS